MAQTNTKYKGGMRDRQRRRRAVLMVCERHDISAPAKATYTLMIHKYSDDGAKTCWPSQVTIAKALGVTDRTVRRHIAELKAAGVIDVHGSPTIREADGTLHRAHTNRYQFQVPRAVTHRRKSLNNRQEIGRPENHITTLCRDKTLREKHVFDQNWPDEPPDSWKFDRELITAARRMLNPDA